MKFALYEVCILLTPSGALLFYSNIFLGTDHPYHIWLERMMCESVLLEAQTHLKFRNAHTISPLKL